MPCLSSIGKSKNKDKDGRTSQKILDDNVLTLEISFVSIYNHIIAKTDTKGTEARIAPMNVLRLLISEIITINSVVIRTFSV